MLTIAQRIRNAAVTGKGLRVGAEDARELLGLERSVAEQVRLDDSAGFEAPLPEREVPAAPAAASADEGLTLTTGPGSTGPGPIGTGSTGNPFTTGR